MKKLNQKKNHKQPNGKKKKGEAAMEATTSTVKVPGPYKAKVMAPEKTRAVEEFLKRFQKPSPKSGKESKNGTIS